MYNPSIGGKDLSFDTIRKKSPSLEKQVNHKKRGFRRLFSPNTHYRAFSKGAFLMLFFIGVAFFVFFGNLNNTNGGYGTKEKSPENRVLGAFYEPLNISNMLFLNPKKVDLLPKLYQKGAFDRIYAQVEQKYGVPRQIIAAIHMVESNQSADNQRVSRAGAVGPMQFMPRTWEAYKQDGNNDGVASIYSVEDALYSAGNMLRANGAARGNLRGAIFNYNHSQAYVERVLALARGMGFAGN